MDQTLHGGGTRSTECPSCLILVLLLNFAVEVVLEVGNDYIHYSSIHYFLVVIHNYCLVKSLCGCLSFNTHTVY